MSTTANRQPLLPLNPLPPPPSPATSLGDAEEAVRPLLARANLLRLRGQWEEAVAVCTEALRLMPSSASAHALLGDIYEAQGRPDDALPWYGMAIDLDPSNAADRAKFERLRDLQRARLASLVPSPSPLMQSASRPAAEKTLEWFDRLFPPGRADGIARLIFAVCGVVALLLLVLAAVFYVALPRNGSAGEVPTTAASHAAETIPIPVQHHAVSPVVMHPSTVSRPASLDFVSLRTQLAAALPEATLAPLSANRSATAANSLTLDLTMPTRPSALEVTEPVERLRERVRDTAVQATRTAAEIAPSALRQITVRVFVRDAVHSTAALTASATPAFTGTALVSTFRAGEADRTSKQDWLPRFQRLQWGPPLESPNAPASGETKMASVSGGSGE